MFPQLPVTQPPCLSASTSLFLYLASSNQRLIKVSTVTSYQLHNILPHLYVFSSPCLPIINYSLASRNARLTTVATITSHDSCHLYHLSLCSSMESHTYHNFHNYQLQGPLSQCFFHIAKGQPVKFRITKLLSYRVTKSSFFSMPPALPLLPVINS